MRQAKAQRPWFRKKRFAIPLGAFASLVVLGMIGGAMSPTPDRDGAATASDAVATPAATADALADPRTPKATEQPVAEAAQSEKAVRGAKLNPYRVGQPANAAGTTYTVTAAEVMDSVGGDYGTAADGQFVVIDMTVENTRDITKKFRDDAVTFIAKDGSQYTADTLASIYLNGDDLIYEQVEPDLPTRGQLVFDVPASKVKGGSLRVDDLFDRADAYIKVTY
ncbi:MAG: DUF4352 domain-containing protein [Nocardioidaceae bacterium]|nr:DUF4352 domain-containing protein [Nocardioidaceae bacterium]